MATATAATRRPHRAPCTSLHTSRRSTPWRTHQMRRAEMAIPRTAFQSHFTTTPGPGIGSGARQYPSGGTHVPGSGTRRGASLRSSRISRTARSIPTSIALETMEWPMFTSSTSGSAARGRMFS